MNTCARCITGLLALALLSGGGGAALAATPGSGTLSPDNPQLGYTSGPFLVSNPAGTCSPPLQPCDEYTLNVSLPDDYAQTHPNARIRVFVSWPDGAAAEDYDLYVLDSGGNDAAPPSDTLADPEVVLLPAGSGSYPLTVRVIPFRVAGGTINASISLDTGASAARQANGPAPRFRNYEAPRDLGWMFQSEPSIGVNRETGVILYQDLLNTLKITFDDSTSPARASWSNTGSQITSTESEDPILFTDPYTNRTFVSQLLLACSAMAYSDDDGESWTPTEGCGPGALFDHQTVGGGPYAHLPGGTAMPTTVYPDAVYYCAQADVSAQCARSDDGGLTFGPGVPIYTINDSCDGLHGHLKVGPEGVVYVPNGSCQGRQGMAVSEDNGQTWDVRTDPASLPTIGSDPSIGIGSQGTVYFGYQNADGHARIAVSNDHGLHWVNDQDVGLQLDVQNAVFPAVVAGDDDRAAFAFYGTTTPGDYQADDFQGVWYLYIATTFDHGQTWVTVNATPNDPIQRGPICTGGTGCTGARNLLDFFDATVDGQGRVLVGYADGCIGNCTTAPPNTGGTLAGIARQSGGPRLFSRFDPPEPMAPKAPLLESADQNSSGVSLVWGAPDNGGADITGYDIYRGTAPGAEELLASTGTKPEFTDSTADPDGTYYYQVSAENAEGEGPLSNELEATPSPPAPAENPCKTPGITVIDDAAGDQEGAPAGTQFDIQGVSVAEPYFPDGSRKVVFTMKVADMEVLPPGGRWEIDFTGADNRRYFVAMNTQSGTPVFEYGHQEALVVLLTDVVDGQADAGSGVAPDGTITFVLSNDKFGNPGPGDGLGGISGITKVEAEVDGTGRRLTTADDTDIGFYTLVGNGACKASEPPVAALSADPQSGFAPLEVTLDGSNSSDPDQGDSVVSYTFDFGDGSEPVTQSAPTVTHTYQSAGSYDAMLTVMDSHGLESKSPAHAAITVSEASSMRGVKAGGYLAQPGDAAGKVNFSFAAGPDSTGRVNYNDNVNNIKFVTDSVEDYRQDDNCATLSGPATLKSTGEAIQYRIDACDNGKPGRGHDTFAIDISGAAASSRSGTLGGGDVTIE